MLPSFVRPDASAPHGRRPAAEVLGFTAAIACFLGITAFVAALKATVPVKEAAASGLRASAGHAEEIKRLSAELMAARSVMEETARDAADATALADGTVNT